MLKGILANKKKRSDNFVINSYSIFKEGIKTMASLLLRSSSSFLTKSLKSVHSPSGTLFVRSVHLKKHEAENDVKGFTLVS